ncbi:3' terminal RNA ribose 2'-O-methyltransferase Hen1 [Rugosimonospora africana]|uniref:Small RNA 2'-O-methyltransferase n=1 Tax=Rugosimonospora africana TaxID=556532 RepID=A0A8J3VQ60_9ACTN|nr:3' terminal RNA ribose 2'-O-methyltransferase Hen1 [Rugosimonospora africana]GIH14023.1 3' terminal RNA ribose 2'-O-methyltransferase Hen1 [Rugosimonospora africana]
MLLTITSTAPVATDLGFLLHKHPGRVQEFDLAAGRAHVFYPEADERRCTAALLLEVDPIALVRGRRAGAPDAFSLAQYVNDRPYAASSMLAVALGRVFRTALAGRCDARPDLPGRPLPLAIHVPALACRGGAALAERLFAPLGWSVRATAVALDPAIPAWGESRYLDLRLSGEVRLADALNHLYVLLPVLDDAKHYWVGIDEVEKLVRAGQGWLGTHPERRLIAERYLAHRRGLVTTAVGRLAEVDDTEPEVLDNAVPDDEPAEPAGIPPTADTLVATGTLATADTLVAGGTQATAAGTADEASEAVADRQPGLAVQRRNAVLAALRAAGAGRVVDLGCGGGALTGDLLDEPSVTQVLGVDVSHRALEVAARRLRLDRLPEKRRDRVTLIQSSLTYRDTRIAGFDAAVLMEVIEHLDPPRLPALERCVFGYARPGTVVVTTPNAEYNVRYPGLPAGTLRHRDHRFEWTREQFRQWAAGVASRYGYAVRHEPVGPDDPEVGSPTQLAVFTDASDSKAVADMTGGTAETNEASAKTNEASGTTADDEAKGEAA